MNNRETARRSPDAGDPGNQNDQRQHQSQTDQSGGIERTGRNFLGSARSGDRFTHIHINWKRRKLHVYVAGRTKFGVAGVLSTVTMAYGRRIAAQLIRSSKHDWNRLFLSTVNLALSALPQCDADFDQTCCGVCEQRREPPIHGSLSMSEYL